MTKLPKNHPLITELKEKIEHAKKHAKEEAREGKLFIANQLRIIFDKQLAKHRDKTEKLLRELEIISS